MADLSPKHFDLAVKRLVDNSEYVLSTSELRVAARNIRASP